MQILRIVPDDFDAVLALNESVVPHVNSIGHEELRWFTDHAAYCHAVKSAGRLAGFLIGLRPGTEYKSLNYRWFCERYEDFAYIDRVAVANWARRRGIAALLYDDFATSQADAPRMTCEVNIRPPNEGSQLFHQRQGFRPVGSQELDGGTKEVSLLEKRLD